MATTDDIKVRLNTWRDNAINNARTMNDYAEEAIANGDMDHARKMAERARLYLRDYDTYTQVMELFT